MSGDVPIEPCRSCGVPKRIDTWCATEQCAERVAKAQAEERERLRQNCAKAARTPCGWSPVYVDGVPVEMRWDETPQRVERRCPRSWPHEAHEPWFDGEIRPIADAVSFSCPGVPVEGR